MDAVPPPERRRRRWSLARQLLLVQLVLVVVLVGAGAALAYFDSARVTDARAEEEVTTVAVGVADNPGVVAALGTPDPSRDLQPYAERLRTDTGVDFITIMTVDGVRFTHPNPSLIGQPFVGNIEPAVRGALFTETYTGTLGPSVRVVAPIRGAAGEVVALVSVGITVRALSAELRERLVPVFGVAGLVLAVGIAGSLLVSARLRRHTRGMGPAELAHLFDYHEAALHAVREGLLLIDTDGRVALCNDAARDLLGLRDDPAGTAVTDLGLPPTLAGLLGGEETRTDEIVVTDTRVLVVSTEPVRTRGRAVGTVATLRDHTELQTLTGELDTVRGFAESLRSQAHEAANRLHTVVSLVEMGRTDQALAFATAELELAQRLTDQVVAAVSEPVLAAVLLGKAAEASERGAELVVTDDTALAEPLPWIEPRDLVTIVGNLIDNALDAAIAASADGRPRVTVTVRADDVKVLVRVADTGAGVRPEEVEQLFRRGWSTKSGGRGLGLALVGQTVRRHGGQVEVDPGPGAVFTVHLPIPGERP
ncbi:sensor histidine kinase [Amycolatopsis suaedae]|uniref:histidine kinase n=1 Tax=Amycolatopsis suaedae TaxID=2510978 RepID=A0A4Q7J5T3_9PSEU|nr:sensor histidine kinase [Amycolatopsis suaedae]RZQ62950.1 sensor histidine kinase [Amycolatopsis suaedae]